MLEKLKMLLNGNAEAQALIAEAEAEAIRNASGGVPAQPQAVMMVQVDDLDAYAPPKRCVSLLERFKAERVA